MENDVAEALQRHRAFWSREKVDRPLISVRRYSPLRYKRLPLADGNLAEADALANWMRFHAEWMNGGAVEREWADILTACLALRHFSCAGRAQTRTPRGYSRGSPPSQCA